MVRRSAKVAALPVGCASKEETQQKIKELGDVRREIQRIEAEANDKIAEIANGMKEQVNALQAQQESLLKMIQVWCEGNRAQLCPAEKKSANLLTGEVAWRQAPPSVRITGVDAVIEQLVEGNLGQFIRTKTEINKEAILNDPDAVAHVPGIKIVSKQEFFMVTPFEVEVAK